MTPLRKRYVDDLRLKNFSPTTIKVYVDAMVAFTKFCGRSPADLGEEDVRKYLVQPSKRVPIKIRSGRLTVLSLRLM